MPGLQRLYRTGLYWAHEAYVPAFTLQPKLAAPARKAALEQHRARASRTPSCARRSRRTSRSAASGCCAPTTYYPALDADNTELVTDPIAKVTGNAIVTADGVEREIDVLVVATGFYTTELPITEHVTGRHGPDAWPTGGATTGMAAYKGTTIPDFPNLFMLVGPNTGQGHTSMVFIIESQVAYIRDAIRTMRREGLAARRADPGRPPTRWNRSLQKRMGRTVWTTGGCQSWYLDAHGRNTTLWPRSTVDFRRRLASFDADAYQDARPTKASHEDARRQGRRDHRRRLRHRPGPGPQPGPPRLAARAVRRRRGRAGRDRRAGRAGPALARCAATGSTSPTATRSARYALDVVQQFGRVNVVINNAGVALAGDFTDLEYADIDWIVGVNFWGVVHGTKEFLPHLIASGDGHVVNLSSLFGLVSMPGQSMYNATKYAVRGMTEALREEMLIAGHPVGVTAVHPGGIKTAIARNARVSAKEDKEATAELFDEKLARMTPERAAEIIVNGILKNRARVLVGIDAHADAPPGQAARLALPGRRRQDASKRVLPAKATIV